MSRARRAWAASIAGCALALFLAPARAEDVPETVPGAFRAASGARPETTPGTPGFAGKSVEWWIEELAKDDTMDIALAALRATGKAAQLPLARALRDERPALRERAAQAIVLQGLVVPEAVDPILAALDDPSATVRAGLLRALADGPAGRAAAAKALTLAADPSVEVRRAALRVVARYPHGLDDAVPVLVAALRDTDAEVREAAAGALAGLGREAADAVPALIPLTKDQAIFVRQTALVALEKSGVRTPEVLAAFLSARKDPVAAVRSDALTGLFRFAATSPEARSALHEALASTDTLELHRALGAVHALGPAGAEFLPEVVRALRDERPSVWREAEGALDGLQEAAAPAIEDLVRHAIRQLTWREGPSPVLRNLAARVPAVLLAAWGADPSRQAVLLEAMEFVPESALRTLGPRLVETLAPVPANARAPRSTRAAALRLVVRAGTASDAARTPAIEAVKAFLGSITPSPGDAYGDAWMLRADPTRGLPSDARARAPLLTIEALEAFLLDPAADLGQRVEVLRVLVQLTREGVTGAGEALRRVAEGRDVALRAAAQRATEELKREGVMAVPRSPR